MKTQLKEARKILDALQLDQQDQRDACEHLAKLTQELEKPPTEQNQSRIKRYFDGFRAVAPAAAAVLSIAASIVKLSAH